MLPSDSSVMPEKEGTMLPFTAHIHYAGVRKGPSTELFLFPPVYLLKHNGLMKWPRSKYVFI